MKIEDQSEEQKRILKEMGEIAKNDFMTFIILFWGEAQGKGKFKPLWHVEALVEHLHALKEREILKLGVSIQPGLGKSIVCSVLFPVWCWLSDPTEQFITATYGDNLRSRDALRSKDVINSEKFQFLYGDYIKLRKDRTAVTRYQNTKGGYRIATTVRGGGTGERADGLIVDDPHKAQERNRLKDLKTVRDWYDTTITNRYNDPKRFMQLIIHQRIVENDLMGHIRAHDSEFVHLRLPNEYDGNKIITAIGWSDPRTKIGELIAPELFDKDDTLEQKRKGKLYYECQYQQNATLKEGSLVSRNDFNFYKTPPNLNKYDGLFTSWDMGEGDPDNEKNEDLSFTVGLVWGNIGKSLFLLHMERGTWVFNKQLEKFQFVQHNIYKNKIKKHLIEKRSNGTAVGNLLESKYNVTNLEMINPKDFGEHKENRFDLALPTIKEKNIWLPDPDYYDWGDTVINEILKFPNGAKDDIVDSTTQFINYMNYNNLLEKTKELVLPSPEDSKKLNPHTVFNDTGGDYYNNLGEIKELFDFN